MIVRHLAIALISNLPEFFCLTLFTKHIKLMSKKRPSPSLFFSLSQRLRALSGRGLDQLFPPTCVGCERAGYLLCPACAQAVESVGDHICAHCGRQQQQRTDRCSVCIKEEESPLTLMRAAALHTWPLREAIHALKYEGQPALADPLARYLCAVFSRPPWTDLHTEIDAVVPAPLHTQRKTERGYNQATLLARHLSRATGFPLQTGLLQRTEFTRPQVGLNAQERRANVADAFTASPLVHGKTLLLIDDVYTTGATMTACALAARKAGASAVYGLALALPSKAR